jgi:hypothetical protein
MSTKFEQLLDLLVNEEMDKANELFHEIVVDKSREIYENLIAEEEDEEEMDESAEDDEEEMDESAESDDEEMDESADEEADESMDLEDSYMMDGDDEDDIGGDATDDLGGDIGAMDDEPEMGGEEGSEEQAIFDIKNAIAELEAAFAELEQAQGGEMGAGDEFGDEEGEEDGDEMMGSQAFESRRLREYSETVSAGHGADKKGAAEGGIAGANTGDSMPSGTNTKSPISSGKGKPTTGATAGNILGDQKVGKGTNTGERPDSLNKGIAQVAGEKFASGLNNVDGKKSGVKTLGKVANGHGAEKKGAGPGPVGSGTGDKAGQTSVNADRPFLKKL